MIDVDLRVPDSATGEYATVATIRVRDGRTEITGRGELLDTSVAVIDRRTGQRVRFDQDPEAWARNLDSVYRAGDLVPVVVADSDPNPPVVRAGRPDIVVPELQPNR